jgi:hypothetical protein
MARNPAERMHRQKVMQLLASYVEVVTSASTTCECPETQREYEERARSGKQLLSRWREAVLRTI